MKAKIYQAEIDVRFTDFDLYGHVNAGRFLDFVTCSRIKYMETVLNISMDECRRRGVVFFLRKSTIDYKKGIETVGPVLVKSYVGQVRGPLLSVPFEITSLNGEDSYSEGILEVMILDAESKRPRRLKGWVEGLFFDLPQTSPVLEAEALTSVDMID